MDHRYLDRKKWEGEQRTSQRSEYDVKARAGSRAVSYTCLKLQTWLVGQTGNRHVEDDWWGVSKSSSIINSSDSSRSRSITSSTPKTVILHICLFFYINYIVFFILSVSFDILHNKMTGLLISIVNTSRCDDKFTLTVRHLAFLLIFMYNNYCSLFQKLRLKYSCQIG